VPGLNTAYAVHNHVYITIKQTMKPNDKKEGETPFAPTSPLTETQELAEAKLAVKQVKLTPEGHQPS
jgi:hypothetical protein